MRSYRFLCGCPNYSKIIIRNAHFRSKYIPNYPKLVGGKVLKDPVKEITLEEKIFNSLDGKVIYNSLVTRKNLITRWKIRAAEMREKKLEHPSVVPISLKYMFEDDDISKCSAQEVHDDDIVEQYDNENNCIGEYDEYSDEDGEHVNEAHFPYSRTSPVEMDPEFEDSDDIIEEKKTLLEYQDINPKPIYGRRWMSDYEVFDEEVPDDTLIESSEIDYGTPDPTYPVSNIPCGGCGAHFHCQNPSIPGYLPQELFKKCKKRDLMKSLCQRCNFMKNYNIALNVNVDTEIYPKLLSQIKNKNALVVLMVDMTDFPCSIWPNLLETIGDKPLILVGNKIDLLPGDSPGWLNEAMKSLRSYFPKEADILHSCFISAKTGYGIEELINKLFSKWGRNGDVYIIGCTNVGKSSLFNRLIRSDYCRSKAIDLIQRAVTSPWPGTTLNLLKFPVNHLTGWKAFLRTNRLITEKSMLQKERKLAEIQARMDNLRISKLPSIIGTIGTTFKKPPTEFTTHNLSPESMFTMPDALSKKKTRDYFNPGDKDFKFSTWCYDTPGVVHNDQIIDLLTTDELMKVIPQKTIAPRIFSVRPEQTLYIGGTARIDVLNCDSIFPRIIVYASALLPITLCETKFAQDVYEILVGTSYMGVPCGSWERIEKWPTLECKDDYSIDGQGNAFVSSEIVLSSIGWIGVSLPVKCKTTIRPWTPLARGIYLRETPVLKLTSKLRKKRIANTPTYYMGSV